jgi:hypothetical protein
LFALTDSQLKIVVTAARSLQPDRRDLFLQRVAAMLKLKGRFDDHDVSRVTGLAACGLITTNAA